MLLIQGGLRGWLIESMVVGGGMGDTSGLMWIAAVWLR